MPLRPLRIVHLAATPIGAPWMVSIMREQRRRGHDVSAVIARVSDGVRGTLASLFDAEGFAYRIADMDLMASTTAFRAAAKLRRLTRLLVELRADVVQYHLFPSIVIGRLAAWLADAPLRYSMIPGTLYLEAPLLGDLEAGTAWPDTKVIATCARTRELYVERGTESERVDLIYYGLDETQWDPSRADPFRVRRELGLRDDVPVVGMVAYFYAPLRNAYLTPPHLLGRGVKGHDVLLRAIPRILEQHPDAKFVLVGRGWGPEGEAYKNEMQALARSLGIAGSVIFAAERDDIPDALASFDVALQCSLCENLGGSIEALMMERPLIASRIGGLVDSVLHEQTGLLVEPGDAEALAAAVARLIADRPLARRLGAEGRRWMLERFTLRRTVDDLEALYERDLVNKPRYRLSRRLLRLAASPFRLGPLVLKVQSIRFAHVSGAWVRARVAGLFLRALRPVTPEPLRAMWRRWRNAA